MIEARLPDSDNRSLTIPGGSTGLRLVYVFTVVCPYCAQQRPGWERIADLASRLAVPTIAITALDADQQFFDAESTVEVATIPVAGLTSWGVSVVPTTLLLRDADGEVLFSHAGLLSEAAEKRLLGALEGAR